MAKYNVGGFTFTDEETAKKAAKELKAVEYILSQLKDADDEKVLKTYNKMVEQHMFSTEVGLSFLNQLKQNLVNCGDLEEEAETVTTGEVAMAEVPEKKEKVTTNDAKVITNKADKKDEKGFKSTNAEIRRLKRINKLLLVICIALLLCILGMFYVNTTINSPTILNYEEQLIDKYSEWEQNLTERENALRNKELAQ